MAPVTDEPIALEYVGTAWSVIGIESSSGVVRWEFASIDAQRDLDALRDAGVLVTAQTRRTDGRFVLLARRRKQ